MRPLSFLRNSVKRVSDIVWNPSLEIGEPDLDAQHRMLVSLIGRLGRALAHEIEKDDLVRLLHEIKKYAEYHFASEENYMHEIRYPQRIEHEHVHSTMLSELSVRILKARQSWRHADPVLDFLCQWLRYHIAQEDTKIAAYARELAARGGLALLRNQP